MRLTRVDKMLQQWERVQQWAALPGEASRPALTCQTLRELRVLLLEELTRLEETT